MSQPKTRTRYLAFEFDTAATHPLVSTEPGFKVRVLQYTITSASAVIAKFVSSTPTDLTGGLHLGSGSVSSIAADQAGLFETEVDKDLGLTLSDGVPTGGHLVYKLVKA